MLIKSICINKNFEPVTKSMHVCAQFAMVHFYIVQGRLLNIKVVIKIYNFLKVTEACNCKRVKDLRQFFLYSQHNYH